ncbi:MAG: O-antigen ligase family protein [Glaciecola sp.]
MVNTEKRIKQLLVVILAAGVFQAIYGIVEILFQTNQSLIFNLGVNNVATGSFVYKNHYANFLMMSLAAAIGLLVSAIQKNSLLNSKEVIRSVLLTMLSRKALIRICIAIMVIGLVMSRSRMGNTAFFVSMTVTGVLALILMKRKSKGLSFLVASMFIVDLLIVSAYFGLENVKTRLVETNLSQESRDEVILDALPIVSDFPIFGTGAGSFYSVFPAYQNAEVLDFYDHAHNDYLQFAIEYGLLGFFFLACLYLTALSLSFKAMRNRRRSIFKGLSFACLMVFIGMGLHMTVDFPLQAYANACYLVIFVALSCIANSLQIRSKSR